ncbi:MAG: hypothetical protein EON58_08305 [Alphaproteobacteria bacterium]|nr:MAG: hypothetical protein EON58_08305 [Alphaproteobacteria bacterium]
MRIEPLRFPSIRRVMIRIHGDLFTIDRYVSSWDEDPELSKLEKLVLVLEDRRFLRHDGFDLIASSREIGKKLMFRKHGGASTIDMQFVRTATGYRRRKLHRKLYEMFLSVLIQFRYSKLRILRSYLNCAYFGSGLKGAHEACAAFGKSIWMIDDMETAKLAAMLVYPMPRKPSKNWHQKVEKRAKYGLLRLRKFEQEFEKLPRRR